MIAQGKDGKLSGFDDHGIALKTPGGRVVMPILTVAHIKEGNR